MLFCRHFTDQLVSLVLSASGWGLEFPQNYKWALEYRNQFAWSNGFGNRPCGALSKNSALSKQCPHNSPGISQTRSYSGANHLHFCSALGLLFHLLCTQGNRCHKHHLRPNNNDPPLLFQIYSGIQIWLLGKVRQILFYIQTTLHKIQLTSRQTIHQKLD